MYPHALIIVALSASTIAEYSLTAYDHTDSTCKGTAIGNHIVLYASQCTLYQPEQSDAYIEAAWNPGDLGTFHNISIFSDINCRNEIASIGIGEHEASSDGECESMSHIAGGPWGSATVSARS